MLKDVTGSHHIDVPIDDSVLDFTVHLAGYMASAVIQDDTGVYTPSLIPSLLAVLSKRHKCNLKRFNSQYNNLKNAKTVTRVKSPHLTSGKTYDLLNDAALTAAGVEVVTSSEALRLIRFPHPHLGVWPLDLAADSSFSVTVSANSSLSWLGGFAILDPSPPHPHYRAVEGRPLTGQLHRYTNI